MCLSATGKERDVRRVAAGGPEGWYHTCDDPEPDVGTVDPREEDAPMAARDKPEVSLLDSVPVAREATLDSLRLLIGSSESSA